MQLCGLKTRNYITQETETEEQKKSGKVKGLKNYGSGPTNLSLQKAILRPF